MLNSGRLRAVLSLVALATLSLGTRSIAVAAEPRVDALSIIEAGFYSARKTGEVRAPGTVLGHVSELADIKFFDDPPAVTAKLGTSFGVNFKIIGEDRGGTAKLRSVWTIPDPGIRNPKNNNVNRQSVSEFSVTIGGTTTRGYSFDEPWEIVRGVWTLEIFQGERRLLRRNFMIE